MHRMAPLFIYAGSFLVYSLLGTAVLRGIARPMVGRQITWQRSWVIMSLVMVFATAICVVTGVSMENGILEGPQAFYLAAGLICMTMLSLARSQLSISWLQATAVTTVILLVNSIFGTAIMFLVLFFTGGFGC